MNSVCKSACQGAVVGDYCQAHQEDRKRDERETKIKAADAAQIKATEDSKLEAAQCAVVEDLQAAVEDRTYTAVCLDAGVVFNKVPMTLYRGTSDPKSVLPKGGMRTPFVLDHGSLDFHKLKNHDHLPESSSDALLFRYGAEYGLEGLSLDSSRLSNSRHLLVLKAGTDLGPKLGVSYCPVGGEPQLEILAADRQLVMEPKNVSYGDPRPPLSTHWLLVPLDEMTLGDFEEAVKALPWTLDDNAPLKVPSLTDHACLSGAEGVVMYALRYACEQDDEGVLDWRVLYESLLEKHVSSRHSNGPRQSFFMSPRLKDALFIYSRHLETVDDDYAPQDMMTISTLFYHPEGCFSV